MPNYRILSDDFVNGSFYRFYKWLESEDDDSFFEIKIQVDALTKDVSLIITDFADDEDEVEESKQLWENQIDELKHTIGA